MPATVNVNERTVVHATSDGLVVGAPDVCRTPAPPGPPVPIPYPNVAMSSDASDGSPDVFVDGNPVLIASSCFAESSGDEAGSVGGVVSGVNRGKATFVSYSTDVKVDGEGVARQADLMLLNGGGSPNTPPFPLIQPPLGGGAGGAEGDGDDSSVELQSVELV